MFGRFVSEEIFEKKKKKTLYRKRGKTYETKQEKKRRSMLLVFGNKSFEKRAGLPIKIKF
jgi:hypothetical protein